MTHMSPKFSDENAMNDQNAKQSQKDPNEHSGSSHPSGQDELFSDYQTAESKLFSPQLENQPTIKPGSYKDETAMQLSSEGKQKSFWGRLSLRNKTVLAAIALGTLPVLAIGGATNYFAGQVLYEQTKQEKLSRTIDMVDEINRFMYERYGDIQVLANLTAFTNPQVRAATSFQEKQALLDRYLQAFGNIYTSIAVFDLNGDMIAQSRGKAVGNHKDRPYFQAALKTDGPVISQPINSESTGVLSIYTAAPVKDTVTGKTIGVVRARIAVENIENVVKNYGSNGDDYHLIDPSGKFFIAARKNHVGKDALTHFANFARYRAARKPYASLDIHTADKAEQLVAYAPLGKYEGLPQLNWEVVIASDKAVAFVAQRQLLLTLLVGTGVTALLVSAIAAYIANRATRPIVAAADAVEKLGQGELDTRLTVEGEDELATLGSNINQMATQLQSLLQTQTAQTEQANFLSEIASSRDQESQDLETVFNKAVQGVRELLKADRVFVYRFNSDWSGNIVAEAAIPGLAPTLGEKVTDTYFTESKEGVERYRNGRIFVINDIYQAGLTPCHIEVYERFGIKANVIVPVRKENQLFGLICTQQCSSPREWQQSEINFLTQLAAQVGVILNRLSFLEQKQATAERASTIKDITLKLSQGIQAQEILETTVQEIRQAINSDRVVVYSFNEQWKGKVIAESVTSGWTKALGADIDDPCFAQGYVEKYRRGRVQATTNIYEAGLTDCHIKQLEQFAVKANLVAPIIRGNQLLGLLIAHQCDAPRQWQQEDIDLFSQVATQVGLALDRAFLWEQQKSAKELFQRRALELLMEVDPVSKGDLTIRAKVTEDEIGTIADSYNATIGSLRKIVTQVQAAAQQVAKTTTSSESSVQELSQEALRQAEEIAVALKQLQEMTKSIRAVAKSAGLAKAAVQQANQTVAAGDAAMNRTVDGMMAIRKTVAETSKKVKRLGESSQKITKVVNLISTFADQTNLLALNASIEAAHAGEQGRGFAVVADEVRTLARQSAEATAEIESLVKDIQTETNEVVAAMEEGTEQVVTGTALVNETRQNLLQITEVSQQISDLVATIVQSAVAQSQASQVMTAKMTDVAAIASQTSDEATVVSSAFKELLALAQELQASASQFKVS